MKLDFCFSLSFSIDLHFLVSISYKPKTRLFFYVRSEKNCSGKSNTEFCKESLKGSKIVLAFF